MGTIVIYGFAWKLWRGLLRSNGSPMKSEILCLCGAVAISGFSCNTLLEFAANVTNIHCWTILTPAFNNERRGVTVNRLELDFACFIVDQNVGKVWYQPTQSTSILAINGGPGLIAVRELVLWIRHQLLGIGGLCNSWCEWQDHRGSNAADRKKVATWRHIGGTYRGCGGG